jgi:hypothetical protein
LGLGFVGLKLGLEARIGLEGLGLGLEGLGLGFKRVRVRVNYHSVHLVQYKGGGNPWPHDLLYRQRLEGGGFF